MADFPNDMIDLKIPQRIIYHGWGAKMGLDGFWEGDTYVERVKKIQLKCKTRWLLI